MDGILLWMRYVYVVLWMLCGIFFYIRFRDKGYRAIIGAVIFMLFTPYNVMALSYNTLNIISLLLALLLLSEGENSSLRLFCSGFLMACAVMNSPFLIILYVFLVISCLLHRKYSPKRFIGWITSGALTCAALFLTFVFSKASLSSVISSIPNMVDSAHDSNFVMTFLKNGGKLVLAYHVFFLLLMAELFVAWKWRGKSDKQKQLSVYCSLVTIISCIYISFIKPYDPALGGFSLVLFPVAVFGLSFMIYKKQDDYLVSFYLASLFLSFALACSTNVGPASYCCPLIIACAVIPFFMTDKIMDLIIPVILMAVLLLCKSVYIFEGTAKGNNILCTFGPYKGLRTSEEDLHMYEVRYKDYQFLKNREEPYLMLVSWANWGYLETEKKLEDPYTYLYFYTAEEYFSARERTSHVRSQRTPAIIYIDDSTIYYESENVADTLTLIEQLEYGSVYIESER